MDRISKLTEYLKSNPQDAFLRHALALEYVKIGEELEARRLFEQLLEADPGYVGSYYHLGKLLDRNGKTEEAIAVYEKGMTTAKAAGDQHAYNELQGAYEDLVY